MSKNYTSFFIPPSHSEFQGKKHPVRTKVKFIKVEMFDISVYKSVLILIYLTLVLIKA